MRRGGFGRVRVAAIVTFLGLLGVFFTSPASAIDVGWIGPAPLELNGLDSVAAQSSRAMSPDPRQYHYMAFDSESQLSVLFGGQGMGLGDDFDDTWSYDAGTGLWTEHDPAAKPSARSGHSLAYDAESDRVVLFGGGAGVIALGDTWAYHLNDEEWRNMAPTGGPAAVLGHRMAYDAQSDRVILFGGMEEVFPLRVSDETWAYDLNTNTWTQMSPPTRPSPRAYHGMAYDAGSDRVILFGGDLTFAEGDESDETWAYDYDNDTWALMSPITRPSARFYHAMAYDPDTDRVLLFGGESLGAEKNDTWAYDYDNDRWINQQPAPSPRIRKRHGMAYDAGVNRVVLHGGLGAELYTDTWEYDIVSNVWIPRTLPSEPLALRATAAVEGIELEWDPPASDSGSAIVSYRVYRGETPGDLAFLATATILTFSDDTVSYEVTYYYQVSAVNGAGEGPRSEEVSVLLPDTVDPTIAITSPQGGATLSTDTVAVTGSASDDTSLEKVELSVGGTDWVDASGNTSWSGTLTLAECGDSTIFARATDSAGNTETASVTVSQVCPPWWSNPLILAAIAVPGAAIVVAVALFIRRRGR